MPFWSISLILSHYPIIQHYLFHHSASRSARLCHIVWHPIYQTNPGHPIVLKDSNGWYNSKSAAGYLARNRRIPRALSIGEGSLQSRRVRQPRAKYAQRQIRPARRPMATPYGLFYEITSNSLKSFISGLLLDIYRIKIDWFIIWCHGVMPV